MLTESLWAFLGGCSVPGSACRDPAANVCCTLRSLVQGSINWAVRTAVCSIPLLPNCPQGWNRGVKECGRKEVTEAQFNSHGSLQEFFRLLHGNWIKLLVRSHVHKTPDLLFYICTGSVKFTRNKNLVYNMWKIEGVKVMRKPQLIDVGVETSCKMNCFKYTENVSMPQHPKPSCIHSPWLHQFHSITFQSATIINTGRQIYGCLLASTITVFTVVWKRKSGKSAINLSGCNPDAFIYLLDTSLVA